MKNTYERDGKTYEKKLISTIVEENGKKYAKSEWVDVEVKPVWTDGYRNSNPVNPAEKAPSFKSRWGIKPDGTKD